MPRPGNIRLRRARYADLSGGPMKFGLAPTVGKGQHFWRLNRTGGGPKCCKPPLLPQALELTFDASNGAILYVKFDYSVTTMTKLTALNSTFKDQFKVRHEDTDNNNDISFVNIKEMTVSKAYFNSSKNKLDSMPNTGTNGKVGNYLVLELNTDNTPNNHIPMLNENYVVEYTPGATKGHNVIMSGGDNGKLPHSKQKGKASNSFDFKITDISGGENAQSQKKLVIVTFNHKIAKEGNIVPALAIDPSLGTISTATIVDDYKLQVTVTDAWSENTSYKVTYDPLAIADADQDDNYLKIHNMVNVQNYRVHKVSDSTEKLNK
tara:strand:- start:49 stop:1011 length:963 start_codon:yes stop_codon:yes gene_type:complete